MKRKCLLLLLLLYMGSVAHAQVAISYFPFQSVLSVSSSTDRKLWGEYKVEVNTFSSNMNMEVSPKITVKQDEWVNYYVGAGIGFNPANAAADIPVTNGYFVDFGIRVKPIAKNKAIQGVFELSPYVNNSFSGGNLRARIGLGYNFQKKKKLP